MAGMKVTIKYFASIREAVGQGSQDMQTQATTVGSLRDELLAQGEPYAQVLARGRAVRMALNQSVCDEHALLTEGCEVAFFPPVTGG
jgi:molybdopterin synthase sulfur carrier subunit